MVDGDDYYLTRRALFNRCNLSPWAIAGQQFQESPQPLEISWIREENQDFLSRLGEISDPTERGLVFHEYCLSRFWVHENEEARPTGKRRLRHSYHSVLMGWGVDSNGPSGAILKGWAEHRFGLRTIYHQVALAKEQEAYEQYTRERMRGMTSGLGMQLDLLYTYCQDELRRRHPGERWLTLYRGTHDAQAYTVKTAAHRRDLHLVELNTLSSFTDDPEIAWEFGSLVWKVQVPLAKIVSFSSLLPRSVLKGEQEFIVLGGDYLVRPVGC